MAQKRQTIVTFAVILMVAGLVLYLLRDPAVEVPVVVRQAQAAATTGRLGDVAIVTLANGATVVTCSCADAELLFVGSLSDCHQFAHTYNSEVRRLWEGAVNDQ